jgi:hypothetical protein
MREERARVHVDGVPSGRLNDRKALPHEPFAEVARRGDAILQVVFLDDFPQAHGDRLEVASRATPYVGNPSVRIRSCSSRPASRSSLVPRKPPIFASPSFFAEKVAPSASENISCAIDSTVRAANPVSRVLMKYAFSAKRHASR